MARTKKSTTKKTEKTVAEKATVDLSAEVKTPKTTKTRAGNDNVVVALNYPMGISFNLSRERRVRLNGNAENLRGKDKGQLPTGAFGLTVIPREDWEEIKTKYGMMRLFRSGLIFVSDSKSNAEAEAEEKAETRHGLEPIDPKEDIQLKGRITETTAPAE